MTLPIKPRACFAAATNLGPEDTARFLELHAQYTKAGADPTAAAKSAAQDLIAEIEQEAKELGTLIGPVAAKSGRIEQVWNVVKNFDQAGARNLFLDAVTSHGATGWFSGIQTQYGKAQKNPTTFGVVFNAVQDFIKDVSTFANAAADLAPGILPRLDSTKDVLPKWLGGRGDTPKADVQAAGSALWRGTLEDKLYSDADLARLGLTDEQRGLYHQARAAIDKSLDDMVKTELVRLSRSEAGSIATQAAAQNTAADAAAFISEHVIKLDPESTLPGLMVDKLDQLAKLKEQGYAPLMRFGRHTLHVTGPGRDPVLFHARKRRRGQPARAPAARGSRLRRRHVHAGDDERRGVQAVPGHEPRLARAVRRGHRQPERPEVYQDFLKLTKNNRSALKRMIHRQGIAGYSEDLPRVMASFVTSNARMASGNLHMSNAKMAAEAIPKEMGQLKDDAIRLVDYVQNPQEEAGLARSLLFTTYIGGSVASALVNLTQPFTMSAAVPVDVRRAGQGGRAPDERARAVASGNIDEKVKAAIALGRAERHRQPAGNPPPAGRGHRRRLADTAQGRLRVGLDVQPEPSSSTGA
jgi:hypothetical protein